ncbi:hypothetical protein ABZ896_41455 [Streptomyces sp. NPDC047072]|uniref:hypothetical protein n=1 Tax=Streptomyces sp. NPDC047072 TaxID=3154809 RepID=UPI0033F057C0
MPDVTPEEPGDPRPPYRETHQAAVRQSADDDQLTPLDDYPEIKLTPFDNYEMPSPWDVGWDVHTTDDAG